MHTIDSINKCKKENKKFKITNITDQIILQTSVTRAVFKKLPWQGVPESDKI